MKSNYRIREGLAYFSTEKNKPSVKKSEVVIKEQDQIYYPLPSKN